MAYEQSDAERRMQEDNDKDICPKCGKECCQCDPNEPCACDDKNVDDETMILNSEESIKEAQENRKDIIESFEE